MAPGMVPVTECGDHWAIAGLSPVPLPAPAPIVRPFRSSNLLAGSLVRRVQPVYPPLARNARVQGSVVLFALISKAGAIENLRVVSGHPMLVPAAIEAVSQWRYRPYILNAEAIEVETQITVNFLIIGKLVCELCMKATNARFSGGSSPSVTWAGEPLPI